ncbi:Protein of unknown function (DUF3435) domain containing protein [Elaphomyces granulatus]
MPAGGIRSTVTVPPRALLSAPRLPSGVLAVESIRTTVAGRRRGAEFGSPRRSQAESSGFSNDTIAKVQDLAAITASRPNTLLGLRYRDLVLTLIRDPEGGRPRLFMFLRPEFTKKFLSKKEPNEFKIPEIIFDPTLVLSPHVCLLGMLFHIKAFKTISTTGPGQDTRYDTAHYSD